MAQYTSDFNFPGMLYAVPVEATMANGKLVALDTAAAEKMPGVRGIFHRANIGKIFRSTPVPGFDRVRLEPRPPFEDDLIRYYGSTSLSLWLTLSKPPRPRLTQINHGLREFFV